jgi:hypothetical protein
MKRLMLPAIAAIVLTIVFVCMYAIGQQSIRLGANMPQIQIAEDIAANLDNGQTPVVQLVDHPVIDITKSQAAFVIIYRKDGSIVQSSARLNDKNPELPNGVLKDTDSSYNALTWQPQNGVRLAAVVVKANNYYVLAGRSLKEPEKLVASIGELTVLGYLGSLVVLGGGFVMLNRRK